MDFRQNLLIALRAGFPVIQINTVEVERAVEEIIDVISKINEKLITKQTTVYNIFLWDAVHGLKRLEDIEPIPHTQFPEKAFEKIKSPSSFEVYIFQNLQLVEMNAPRLQWIREAYKIGKTNRKHVILVGDWTDIPMAVRDCVAVLNFDKPDFDELKKLIKEYVEQLGIKKITRKEIDRIARAGSGLTVNEFENAFAATVIKASQTGKVKIDADLIFKEKINLIKQNQLLEYIEDSVDIQDVGGLEILKEEISKIAKAYKEPAKAEKFGIENPKGILLVGMQGSGKTYVAKAIASILEVPLFRADLGKLYSKWVGETEQKTRELFKLIDSLGDCVILLDEIEKVLGGDSAGGRHETTTRLIGSILYYLQERKNRAYFVATANNVWILPPELLRAGRWDDIWFVNLPNFEERQEIFKIHLKKRGRNPENFSINDLAVFSDGFSGAEIESVIKKALFVAFAEDRDITTEDIIHQINQTVPLSKMREEEVKNLIAWAKDRARPANRVSKIKATENKGRMVLHS